MGDPSNPKLTWDDLTEDNTSGAGNSAVGVNKIGSTPTPSNIPHKTTKPESIQRHDISDEELDMLSETRREWLIEAIWGMVGIAFGSVIPAGQSFYASFLAVADLRVALNFTGLIQLMMLSGSILLAAGFGIIAYRRGKTQDDLVTKIRNRKSV